jgi:hypothetical protein
MEATLKLALGGVLLHNNILMIKGYEMRLSLGKYTSFVYVTGVYKTSVGHI